MENENNTDMKETQVSASDLNEKIDEIKKETIDNEEVKKLFNDLDQTDNTDSSITDLFYKSVKLIFDTGFDLAKKLNLDLFESFKFDDKKEEKKEE